jgi:cbb3-type cytochrome oxidase subunit 3
MPFRIFSQGETMTMDQELIGIYKGLRLPLLGMVLLFIIWYVYRPSKKKEMEEARFTMLDDDVDPDLSRKFRQKD